MIILLAIAMFAALILLAHRDHKKLRANRRGLLDHCLHNLDDARIFHGGDDFPSMEGTHRGAFARIDLIPDMMTIRRLPQLWLSVTVAAQRPGMKGFAILVRPGGNEFYSLTSRYPTRLEAPAGFPNEVLIFGAAPEAQTLLNDIAPTAARILADPRVKELAVTAKGIRIIRQTSEGRRGEYLLLRQAVFDDAEIKAEDLESALGEAWALRDAIPNEPHAVAA